MPKEQPVPGYNVVHIIGQGGQAQVYLAERDHDLLRVALKVLNRALRSSGEAHGVLLPGGAVGEAAIALRAGVYPPGENLEATVGGKQHVYMPQGVAERGDDYEIVKFKEMIRE